MKCEVCHKREASVVYIHIVENQKKTLHLCRACISLRQVAQAAAPTLVEKAKADLNQLAKAEESGASRCARCGLSYEEFKKTGRFGCHACYQAFEPQLEGLMKRIHGAVAHQGKGRIERRKLLPPEEELRRLRRELETAVAAEAYEWAAQLRDRIRELEIQPGSGSEQ